MSEERGLVSFERLGAKEVGGMIGGWSERETFGMLLPERVGMKCTSRYSNLLIVRTIKD
jgi:hypothetical protein